jgi:hypothetical protein
MKKLLTATVLGGAIVGSLLGAGTANATDSMYKVGKDIQPGDYVYTVTGSSLGYGSYKLCASPNCEAGTDEMIDIELVFGDNGTTGYLTITSDVKYVKLTNLQLTPA